MIPPRIHVLLARDAPLGVVIRRGPSRAVCTLLWHLEEDRFELGQWLRGRIYERRSDLSPTGSHLIYFAADWRAQRRDEGAWTAISRAPHLKAVTLYDNLKSTYYGGGLFTGASSYWLNGCGSVIRDNGETQRDLAYEPAGPGNSECLGVYYPRLLRDGWTLVERIRTGVYCGLDLFEKPLPAGWTLRKIAHAEIGAPEGRGCYWDEHELVHRATGRADKHPDWEWAEVRNERLLWAANGALWSGRVAEADLVARRQLIDLTAMQFEAIAAPY